MNLQNILSDIENVDPEVYERTSGRRDIFKNFGGFGKKMALTAMPLAFGTIFKKAYGAPPSDVIAVLNFALTLEYLESSFYAKAVGTTNLIPAAELTGFQKISADEAAHVAFLTSAIKSAGGTPAPKPNFDFTAGGTFSDVFTNFQTFLAVSQAFEDTGVRAYKGQAGALKGNASVLTAALNIHSVEARHAAHVRMVRAKNGAIVKPWITGKDSGIASAAVAPIYAGEDNTTQANVQITGIAGTNISANAASEAFDEPLDMTTVLAIAASFIIG